MFQSKLSILLPFALIAIGLGWLLSTLNVTPGVNWIWILCLSLTGLLTMITSGIDKFSVIVGPIFMIAGGMSYLRQAGQLKLELELPILLIALGILMLIARLPTIPRPSWIVDPPASN
jgi:hypothetical protein